MNIYSQTSPAFHTDHKNENPITSFIVESVENRKNMVVVLLDGYPSPKFLSEKYSINSNIDMLLKDFKKIEFVTKYTSTPISVTNLLFNSEYRENEKFKSGQNELALFNMAYEQSHIFPLTQAGYSEFWFSFLASEQMRSVLGHSYWGKNSIMKSTFKGLVNKYFPKGLLNFDLNLDINNEIIRYNNYLLGQLKDLINKSGDKKFIFLHFLTFHSSESLDNQVKEADKLIKKILLSIPDDFSVVFFSDHGCRDFNLNELEKRAGIYFQRN